MKHKLPKPNKKAIIHEDNKIYACLANQPITKGHTVVVWKKPVSDLHLLSRKDYEYLMNEVDEIRSAMLKALKTRKVYLLYRDEAGHVHWHLIPRYNTKGFNALIHKPSKLKDVSLATKIRNEIRR